MTGGRAAASGRKEHVAIHTSASRLRAAANRGLVEFGDDVERRSPPARRDEAGLGENGITNEALSEGRSR
ncbi:hypothetical protein MRX96_016345 [Rhipicephalus microplus]